MQAITVLHGVLVALGLVNFVYQGMTPGTGSAVAGPGQLPVGSQRSRTALLPSVLASVALVGGLVLLYVGASRLVAPVRAVS
jgi:hypothetical protein